MGVPMKTIKYGNNPSMRNRREKASQVLTQSPVLMGECYCTWFWVSIVKMCVHSQSLDLIKTSLEEHHGEY